MMRQPQTVVIRGPAISTPPRARPIDTARLRRRTLLTLAGVLLCLAVIGGQLVRLALRSGPGFQAQKFHDATEPSTEPVHRFRSRTTRLSTPSRSGLSSSAVSEMFIGDR